MKKYTIKDNLGNKKTIYAENVTHAMKFVDSKLKDVSLTNGDWFTLRNDYNATIYKIISVSHDVYVTDVYSVEVDFDAKKSFIRKVGSKSFYTSNIKGRDDITTLAVKFNSAEEAMNWLKRQNRLTSNLFKQHDSELKDAVSLIKGDWFTLRKHNDVVYKVVDDQRKPINGFSGSMIVEAYRIVFTNDYEDYTIKKVGNESFRPDKWSSPDIVKFNSAEEAVNWLRRQLHLKKHEFDSKVKDEAYYKSAKTGVEVVWKDGSYRLRKDGKYSDWSTSDLSNAKFIADRPRAMLTFKWLNDSIHDEASLATTLNALIDDEKAAADAYDVAIKNLEGKIDDTARQVLINIRDDERRHIENLYAILNGQVTEKNLEDSKTANEAER